MKNAKILFFTAIFALSLTACGGSPSTTPENDEPEKSNISTGVSSPAEAAPSDEISTADDGSSKTTRSSSGSTSRSSSTNSSSKSKSSDDYTFEDYLKDNDPESYESYKDLEKGWNSGSWDSETGFFDNDDDDSFKEYLKENDKDAYESYKASSGIPENPTEASPSINRVTDAIKREILSAINIIFFSKSSDPSSNVVCFK